MSLPSSRPETGGSGRQTRRLLLVSGSAGSLGGVPRWLGYLDPGLRRAGWDVIIGLAEGPRYHKPASYVGEHRHAAWIPIPCRTCTPEGRVRALMRVIRATGPDIVASANVPDAHVAVSRLRSKGRTAARSVMTLHGLQGDYFDDIRRLGGLLDAVICTNRLAADLAREVGGMEQSRVGYAPYGVRIDETPRPARAVQPLRIAFAGRLESRQKRVRDLVDIVALLGESGFPMELLIAGSGPEESFLRQRMAAYETAGRVRFLGRLSHERLRPRLHDVADILLLTSAWETGPIVLWEAMAAGLAVVSSRYIGSGLESALRHEENALLFEVGDVRAAVREIARLAADESLRRRLVRNGLALVRDRYSEKASVRAWDEALRDVLARPPRADGPAVLPGAGRSRLDRTLGARVGEWLRSALGKQVRPSGPGAEWPHSYGRAACSDSQFWELARNRDREPW